MNTTGIDPNKLAAYAGETAMHLLDEGLAWSRGFCEVNDLDKLSAAQAILIVGFALLMQRERHCEEERIERFEAQVSGDQGAAPCGIE